VKPENIFLAGSRALLMDVGLSRAITRSMDETMTGSGLTLGAPAYMSPEHASGGVEIDARTDLYSLGCVLYEMLAGRPPFAGGAAHAVLMRTLTEKPALVLSWLSLCAPRRGTRLTPSVIVRRRCRDSQRFHVCLVRRPAFRPRGRKSQETHMRSRLVVLGVTTLALGGVAVFACSDSIAPNKAGTFFGPVTAMGGGTARAYVTLDRSGAPTDLGLALSETALTGLPAAAAEFVFALPAQASATLFKHAVINWMPLGHPPPMVYTVPHFDFHFYTITNAERVGIVLGDSVLAAKMARLPAAEFVPAGYVLGAASVGMGQHWRDAEAPELKGEPFTKTFVYGSYDGAMIFGEPMVALTYLETKPVAVVSPIRLPAQYAVRGYQATSYTVDFDAGAKEYRVALSGLVSR
jgi:hypothetical protein